MLEDKYIVLHLKYKIKYTVMFASCCNSLKLHKNIIFKNTLKLAKPYLTLNKL